MSHFELLDSPQASPGKCGVCGYSGSDRKFLNTRLDFEFYGILIFCADCVGAMANDFGFLSPDQSSDIIQRLEDNEQELVTLRSAVLQLETLGDLVAGLISSKPAVPDDNVSVAVRSSEPESGIPAEPIEAEGSDDSIQRLLDFDVDKQVDEPGPDDLSSLGVQQSTEFSL